MSTPYTLAPYWNEQLFDNAGLVLNGGLIHTYISGTSTPATTYKTQTGTTNTNPIVLDSAGRCVIYLGPLSYKFILTDSLGNVLVTQDAIGAVSTGISGLGAIFTFGSNSTSPITATSYASGATFDKLQPGSAVYAQDSSTLTGTYIIQATGVTSSTNTLTVGIFDLSDGAPDTPLATATMSSTTGTTGDSAAITFGPPGVYKDYGIKTKVDSGSAFLIGVSLLRTA